MTTYLELVAVNATIYTPGDKATYERLLCIDDEMWHFDDPDVESLWDALDNPDLHYGEEAAFTCRAVHFTASPLAAPHSALANGAAWLTEWLLDHEPAAVFGDNLDSWMQHVAAHNHHEAEMMFDLAFLALYEVDHNIEHAHNEYTGWNLSITMRGIIDWSRLPEILLVVGEVNSG